MTVRPRGRPDGPQPWGWWLLQNGEWIEDGKGGRWRSVRDAFWQGHLRFPKTHVAPEQQELLLRVLVGIEHHWFAPADNKHELFGGDMLFWRFYQCWLGSIGLLQVDADTDPLSAPLSEEGRSVRLMLTATAEPEWAELPMPEVVDAVRSANRGAPEDLRESVIRAFEKEVARRPNVFERRTVHRSHLVALTGLSTEGRMPLRRTFWSLSFADADQRDDFYGWLAERVDRWDDWAEVAYRSGAEALTQRLLSLVFVRERAS